MRDKGVYEGTGFIAGRRMNHKPGRFIENDQIIILLKNGKTDGFADRYGGCRRWNIQNKLHAYADRLGRFTQTETVTGQTPFINQVFDAGARQVRKAGRQHAIRALTGEFLGDDQAAWPVA